MISRIVIHRLCIKDSSQIDEYRYAIKGEGKARLRDPASWLLSATWAISRNLAFIFSDMSVRRRRGRRCNGAPRDHNILLLQNPLLPPNLSSPIRCPLFISFLLLPAKLSPVRRRSLHQAHKRLNSPPSVPLTFPFYHKSVQHPSAESLIYQDDGRAKECLPFSRKQYRASLCSLAGNAWSRRPWPEATGRREYNYAL